MKNNEIDENYDHKILCMGVALTNGFQYQKVKVEKAITQVDWVKCQSMAQLERKKQEAKLKIILDGMFMGFKELEDE
jgi:hypothetical protein